MTYETHVNALKELKFVLEQDDIDLSVVDELRSRYIEKYHNTLKTLLKDAINNARANSTVTENK